MTSVVTGDLPLNNDPLHLMNIARRAASESRKVLLHYYGELTKIQEKPKAGLVSEADQESEKTLRAIFAKETPWLDFLGEEEGLSEAKAGQKSVGTWICDPLDGTTNYIHGVPYFCISIGLQINGKLVLGVIDLPILDQQFYAAVGHGAFVNSKPIRVSSKTEMKDGLFATGFSYKPEDIQDQVRCFIPVLQKARGIRRLGAAAIDLCYVASGIFEGYWERHLSPWDLAAGAVLVQEAGGTCTDFSGNPILPYSTEVVAAGAGIHKTLLSHVNCK
jgi:myo-inositol-1(or 4)-monophosphatase